MERREDASKLTEGVEEDSADGRSFSAAIWVIVAELAVLCLEVMVADVVARVGGGGTVEGRMGLE